MRFSLFYRGPLKSSGNAKEKHNLRKHFHRQLKEYWPNCQLQRYQKVLEPNPIGREVSIIKQVGAFNFASIVSSRLKMVAELSLQILRPQIPGHIVSHGGDLDNRLKTLLDALKTPENEGALPNGAQPDQCESPFFCLLEDDALITKLDVDTDQLFDPTADKSDVVLVLKVHTYPSKVEIGNVELLG